MEACSRLVLNNEPITSLAYSRAKSRASFYVSYAKGVDIVIGVVHVFFKFVDRSSGVVFRTVLVRAYNDITTERDSHRGYQRVEKVSWNDPNRSALEMFPVHHIMGKVMMFPTRTNVGDSTLFIQQVYTPDVGLVIPTWRKPT